MTVLLRREEGCLFSQELVVLFAFVDLPLQPGQLCSLVLAHRLRRCPFALGAVLFGFDPGARELLPTPIYLATAAIERPVSMTKVAAARRYSGVNARRCFLLPDMLGILPAGSRISLARVSTEPG